MYLIELCDKSGRFSRQTIGFFKTEEEAKVYCESRNDRYAWEEYTWTEVNLIEEN